MFEIRDHGDYCLDFGFKRTSPFNSEFSYEDICCCGKERYGHCLSFAARFERFGECVNLEFKGGELMWLGRKEMRRDLITGDDMSSRDRMVTKEFCLVKLVPVNLRKHVTCS